MWIVALALRRPYTFVVMALVIILLMPLVILRTPVDIFPAINIPVISVVWNFTGFAPADMADRIITNSERGMTVTVNDIEHIESQSVNGVGVIKVFFQPNANIQTALAQVTAIVQTSVRSLPPGTFPPLVIQYSASSTPIVQLGISSKTMPEQQLFDLGQNFIRSQLATVPGAATPYPYGGKVRQVQVDLDLPELESHGLSPSDIVNAVNAQNVITPSGTAKIGSLEYQLEMNTRSANHRRAEQPAGQDPERLDDLPARSGPCARWLRAANQHRAPGRRARRADVDLQNRLGVDHHHRAGSEEHGAHRAADAAAGRHRETAVRSVAVCARLH